MFDAYICEATRTPFGRYAGVLSSVRPDDLAAVPIRELLRRNSSLDPSAIDDVILGCANQAGEDNRNVARMALLLAGVPLSVPGVTVNRLCGSGLDAVAMAARLIRCGEAEIVIAGGVESMSRAPYVLSKAPAAFARDHQLFDTTIGWRFINPTMSRLYGVDSMPETAEHVAAKYGISRRDQDLFALQSHSRAIAARSHLSEEIVAIDVPGKKGQTILVDTDEHPRPTSLDALANLGTPFLRNGSVTAGNSSGVNDGACALLLASEKAVKAHGLRARARVVASAVAGVEPRLMGTGPIPATRELLRRLDLRIDQIDIFEINEAFAAQAIAVIRDLGLPIDAPHVNVLGGAIALGHPLGASGARLATTALYQLARTGGRRAICTMCIGVGQGIALLIERVGSTDRPSPSGP